MMLSFGILFERIIDDEVNFAYDDDVEQFADDICTMLYNHTSSNFIQQVIDKLNKWENG